MQTRAKQQAGLGEDSLTEDPSRVQPETVWARMGGTEPDCLSLSVWAAGDVYPDCMELFGSALTGGM